MLLNGGVYAGQRFLKSSTIEMMSDNQLRDQQGLPRGIGFGFNFAVVTDPSQLEFASSDGEYYWSGLASSIFGIDPEEELIAIAWTQHLPPRGPLYMALLHRLVHEAIID